jgi:hypothetical protein
MCYPAAILMICALMVGCGSQQTTASVEIIDGCIVRINGLSSTQAQVIVKEWNIDPNCTVDVVTELNQE